MKSLLNPSTGAINTPTILAGEVEIHQGAEFGLMCSALLVWIEGRWTDVEGGKDKGTSICYRLKAEVECFEGARLWLQPGKQRQVIQVILTDCCKSPLQYRPAAYFAPQQPHTDWSSVVLARRDY